MPSPTKAASRSSAGCRTAAPRNSGSITMATSPEPTLRRTSSSCLEIKSLSPKRARSPGARSLVALLILGLAGAARAASYTVRPAIEVEQTHDDNVLSGENQVGNPNDNEIASWGTRIAPSLSVTRKTETSEANLWGELANHNVYSVSDLNGTDEKLAGNVRRILSRRLSVGARGSYEFYPSYNSIEQVNAAGNPQVLFEEQPELTWQNLAADLKYAIDDSTDLTGEVEWNDWKYGSTDRLDLFDNQDRSISLT